MKLFKYLPITLIILCLFSCSEKLERIQNDEIYTLRQTVELLQKTNEIAFHKGEGQLISDGEDRVRGPYLDDVKDILNIKFPEDSLTSESLDSFQTEFIDKTRAFLTDNSYSKDEFDLDSEIMVLNNDLNNWKKSRGEKEYLLMQLDILRMESFVLTTFLRGVGHSIIDYFHGRVLFYQRSDTINSGEQWTSMIILGEPELEDYEYLELTEPQIGFHLSKDEVIMADVPLKYDLEKFQRGAWMLRFTPEESGVYTVGFTTTAYSKLHARELMFLGGSKDIVVR